MADKFGRVVFAPDNADSKRLQDRIADTLNGRDYNEFGFAIDQGYGVYELSRNGPTKESKTDETKSQIPQQSKPIPHLLPKSPYAQAKGQREIPRTITPFEQSRLGTTTPYKPLFHPYRRVKQN